MPDKQIGSYVKTVLTAGEQVEHVAKISLWPFCVWIFVGASWIFGAFIGPSGSGGAGTFLFILGAACLLYVYVTYISTELAVTNKRVIAKFGFIRRMTVEMNINRIESLQIQQSILGRACNYGSIVLSGAGNPQAPIPYVANPLEFRRQFTASQEAASRSAR